MKASTNRVLSIASLILLVAAVILGIMTFVTNQRIVSNTISVAERVNNLGDGVKEIIESSDGTVTSVTVIRNIPRLGDLFTAYSTISDESLTGDDSINIEDITVESLPEGGVLAGIILDDLCPVQPDGPCGFGTDVWIYDDVDTFYLVKRRATGTTVYGPFAGVGEDVTRDRDLLIEYVELLEN